MKSEAGFTLIELIVVIVILGILSVVAFPKFIGVSAEARGAALEQIKVSVETANTFMNLKSHMPSYVSQPVPGRNDLIDVDMDGDGSFDVFNDNSPDVRLVWHYLDNTDIEKRIELQGDFSFEEEGVDFTYIGYDLDGDGDVQDDECYMEYTQAQDVSTPPEYQIVSTGC